MKYKAGDKVRIKSIDWYNENKDENREIKFENGIFTTLKSIFLGQIMTIEEITLEKQYILMEDQYKTLWTDEMIEGPVEEENESELIPYFEEGTNKILYYKNKNTFECYFPMRTPEYICPEGYIFKDENGNVINATKIVLEKKKKEYPKTFLECCDVLGIGNLIERGVKGYKAELFDTLQKLYICRDAYWKIAGDEMGLDKPWAPDWNDEKQDKYGFYNEVKYTIINPAIFVFPTEEMRDAFKENFKICKKPL